MRRCLTFAVILFLSVRGPNAQSAPPNAHRHAPGHTLSPHAATATGQSADQALQNPDAFPPDPDEFQFDPWDIPDPPYPLDIPFPPDDPFDDIPLPPPPFDDPFDDLPDPPPDLPPLPGGDLIPFDPSVSNAPWILDPGYNIFNQELPNLVRSRAAAAPSAGDLVLGTAKPGQLPVMWHARGDTLQHLFEDLLGGPLASAVSGAPASRHGQDAGPVAVADLNGDGVLDAVRLGGNAVYVNLGKSPSGWNAHTLYPIGEAGTQVIVADVNGDGKPDIIVSGAGGNTATDLGAVYLLLNNGDGTFQPATTLSAGPYPGSIAAADFNGDGKVDLAVTNAGNAEVSILLGNGDGTFQAPVAYAVDQYPASMVVADFNGDGKPDIVTASSVNGTVSALLGNGDGTMRKAVTSTASGQFSLPFLAYADLNGDGKLDLAVAAYDRNKVTFLLGQGDGSFQFEREFAIGTGPASIALLPAANGYALVAADDLTQQVRMFIGVKGGLSGRVVHRLGNQIAGVALADLNGDGIPDVIGADQGGAGGGGVVVALGGATLDQPTTYAASLAGDSPAGVAVGDLNGDGKLDVVAASSGSSPGQPGTLSVLLGRGDGTLGTFQTYPAGLRPVSVELADFNGDGKLDAVVGDGGAFPLGTGGGVSILLGKGDGTFGAAASYSSGQFPVLQVHVADLNGDGKPDVVAAVANPDGQGGGVLVFLNKGDGTLQAPINVTFAESGITPQGFAIGDVNGDGHADLVVAYWDADVTFKLAVMLGNGDGTFKAGPVMDDDFGTGAPLLVDLNGDGKLDLFLPHCCGDTEATHRLGNGDGTFQDAIYDGAGPDAQFAASIVRKSGRPLIALAGGSGSGAGGTAVYLGGSPAVQTTQVATPLITGVGVSGGSANIAQNAWVSIYGSNLAPAGVGGLVWSSAPSFASGLMPTDLDGVSVTVNGEPAYIYFISSAQVNVLTPLDSTTGPVAVTVNNGTTTSAPYTANLQTVSPGFLRFGDGIHIAAMHADYSLLGPASMSVPGYTFTPATPGETILLFGDGFGLPVSTLTAGSDVQTGALPTPWPQVTIGGTTATVQFAGLISPGLYQINAVVPSNAANGDNQVLATYDGTSSPTGAMIPVAQ